MTYRHIILTRFNLQYALESDIHIQTAWLEERFRLFEAYCLPSIIGQTNQNFTWIILVHDQTPTIYQQRLEQYVQTYPVIKVEYCSYYDDINILYQNIGRKYIEHYDYLLSTRMDSDDMLALDFVDILQSHLQYIENQATIISFPKGIQWFETKDIAYAIVYPKNHFLTFLEPYDSLRTSLGIDHTKIDTTQLTLISLNAMWCEIVHGNNICNGYFPGYRYSTLIQQRSYPTLITTSHRMRQYAFLLKQMIIFRYHQMLRFLKNGFGHRNV